jgi:CheY-like chemotaxis protein
VRIEVATILDLEGFDVIEAENGREGLNLLAASPPDVILSDLMMPEMDGYELLEATRAHPAWARIPFLVLSARGEQEAVDRAIELGASHYLRKPVDTPALLEALRESLEPPATPAPAA